MRDGYLSLLGYSVFGYVEGLEESPVRLELELPESWPLLTTLAPRHPLPRGHSSASAPNFYALADSQVVAGPKLEVRTLETRPPAYFALYAEGEADDVHDAGVAELFRRCRPDDALGFIAGREVFDQLEKVVDRFDDAANEIEGIVVEHV